MASTTGELPSHPCFLVQQGQSTRRSGEPLDGGASLC
jgi:hypothetical protein